MTKKVRDKEFWFVGKVQVSISGPPSTLIYNKDRKWWVEMERGFGERLLGDRLKGYFKMCHRVDGTLYVDKEVDAQEW